MSPEKTESNPRGAGRKAKPPGEKYESHHIKFLPDEWLEITKKAVSEGLSASEYIRNKALQPE